MSNKITFTFDDGIQWSTGQTFTLNQVDANSGNNDLIWTVGSSPIPQPFHIAYCTACT